MTLRCNRHQKQRRSTLQFIGLSMLLGLTAFCSSATAQNDAPALPEAPQLRKKTSDKPDAEFKSPLKRGGVRVNNANDEGPRPFQRKRPVDADDDGGFNRVGGPPGNEMMDGPPGPPPFGGPDDGGPGGPEFEGPGGPGGPNFGVMQGRRNFNGRMGPRMGGPEGGQFGAGMRPRRGGMGRMDGPFGSMGGHRQLDLTPLNLTEQQKQKIKQIRSATKEKARDVRKNLMTKTVALRTMLFSPTATEAQIRSARKDLRAVQDQMDELNLEDLLQIRALLTAQQKQKLPEIAPPPPGGFRPGGNMVGQRQRGQQPE